MALPWHISQLGIEALWELADKGAGVRVAVLDSGAARAEGLDAPRVSRVECDGESMPDTDKTRDYHGTRVVGIVASTNEKAPGVAPAAECVSICVYDDRGQPSERKAIAAFGAALAAEVDVVCCTFTLTRLSDEVEAALAAVVAANIPVIASAGNDRNKFRPFPERAKDLITVAATTRKDNLLRGRIGDWTSIAAPGWQLPAGVPGRVATITGTSAAAPVAAGVVALAIAYARKQGKAPVEDWLRASLRELLQRTGSGRPPKLIDPAKLFAAIDAEVSNHAST